jgi:hypothetical protein
MSSPSWFADKRPHSDPPPAEAKSIRDSAIREHDLLEAVLRRTMAIEGDGGDSADLRGAVAAVIRRFNGQPMDWDPAVSCLVEVVLREEFQNHPNWAGLWPNLSRKIARTLWEDPHSRSQLERLWVHFSGG